MKKAVHLIKLVTIAIEDGRATLTNDKLVITNHEGKTEANVENDTETLAKWFGIQLS